MKLSKLHSPQNRISESDRKEAAMKYLTGCYRKSELIKEYSTNYASLDKWINQYGPELMKGHKQIKALSLEVSSMKTPKSKSDKELQKRVKELEKQLEMANLKAELLDSMIDIAEQELKVSIRKKSGTQRSKEKRKTNR